MPRYAVLVVSCVLLCLAAPCTAGEHQVTSLCTVLAKPIAFNLQEVHVRGVVGSDTIHRTWLADDSCPDKGGVAFVVLPRSADDPGVKQVMHAIYHFGPRGTFGKHIEATVSGIFLWEPNNSRTSRRLLVESVSDVTVSMAQSKSRKRSKGTKAVKPIP